MTRTIPVSIDGLDLILGGGIPVLKRHKDFAESATLLVRGPPGSGKTIFGVQLAGSLARSLDCDVAYGCVELLPSELQAQHAGIKRSEFNERVVTAPFTKQEPRGDECRIFAEMLNIGSHGEEVSKLGDAIEHVLKVIELAGGQPGVLVIDSLSDGYNLGSSAPRELADVLCKMAARRGIILILLEEIFESSPSAWSFATDVVLQLSPSEEVAAPGPSDSFERRLRVAKNRFGPSEAGVHRYSISPNVGVRVRPAAHAYLSTWAHHIVLPDWKNNNLPSQSWAITLPDSWPSFQTCVSAVYGSEPVNIRQIAHTLGQFTIDGAQLAGTDIFLDFSRGDPQAETADQTAGELYNIRCGDPYLSGDQLLAGALSAVDKIRIEKKFIRRVLVGDLQSLRSFWNAEGIRHALGVLMAILRRVRVPAVLFETAMPKPVQQPRIVDFADVVIEVHSGGNRTVLIASCARRGLRERLEA
ncbi:MAG: RAD55 family ATPase [Byssovorax sp.]